MKKKGVIAGISIAALSALLCGVAVISVQAKEAATTEMRYAPVITIDDLGYGVESAPVAAIGKPYRVFAAQAKNIYEENCDVITKLWINYNSSSKSQIALDDLTFVPSFAGEYTVEYISFGKDGEKSALTYSFTCIDKETLAIDLEDGIVVSGKAGEDVSVADYNILNASGRSECEIVARLKDSLVEYEVGADLTFCPYLSGEYVIEYTFSDYIEVQTESYEITIEKNPVPIFYGDVYVPEYFVYGNPYQLPEWECYHFAFGKKASVTPKIEVIYEDGSSQKLSGFDFNAEKCGKVRIVYTASYGANSISRSFNAEIIDTGYPYTFNPAKYFVSDNCLIEGKREYVTVTALKNDDGVRFINSVLAQSMNLRFSFVENGGAFGELIIYLTDSIDETQKVKVSFIKNDGQTSYVSINDGERYSISLSFLSALSFNLSYSNPDKSISIEEVRNLAIEKTLYGEAFEGFASGKTNVEFCFNNVLGTSSVNIERINNQVMGNETNDVAPYVVYNKYSGGAKKVGDLITIERMYIGDVMDYNMEISYGVKDPMGNDVVDVDGKILGENTDYTTSHSFYATQLGKYNVYLFVKDSMGNEEVYSYAITIIDDIPPMVVLGEGKTQGNVNEGILLKRATATDNINGNLQVNVFVWQPDGIVKYVGKGNEDITYIPMEKGVYTIYYYVMDADGNLVTECYDITIG